MSDENILIALRTNPMTTIPPQVLADVPEDVWVQTLPCVPPLPLVRGVRMEYGYYAVPTVNGWLLNLTETESDSRMMKLLHDARSHLPADVRCNVFVFATQAFHLYGVHFFVRHRDIVYAEARAERQP